MEDSTTNKLSEAEIKALIFKEVPTLIKKDPEIRRFILRISSEKYADKKRTEDRIEKILEELKKDREENQRRFERLVEEWNKKWEENQKRLEKLEQEWNRKWEENQKRLERLEQEWNRKWEENQKRLERLEEGWNRKWEENQKVISRMLEEIRLLRERQEAESKRLDRKIDTTIGALGARWGFRAEASFRNAIREILQELVPFKVERYKTVDEEGIVFGRPDQIELDLLVRNGVLIVAEIKSSISKGDVATFIRKVKVFEKKEGKSVSKMIMISPMIDSSAMEFAMMHGIKVYGYPEDIDIASLQE